MGEQGKGLVPRSMAPPREPSWPVVIRTTIRLWLDRKRASGAGRKMLTVVIIGAVATAATVVIVLYAHGNTASHDNTVRHDVAPRAAAQSSIAVVTDALVRSQTAGWIAQQVSPGAIVACDPEMCSVLTANGLPATQLLTLPLTATDPLGADIVVATPAVRDQLGGRLTSVYAPEVIASFGSGTAQIDVRAVAPNGAAAFEAGLSKEQTDRISAGQQLLRNKHIRVSAAARADLTAGDVDPRLLTSLAALAAQHQVMIASFDDPSPGAPDAPLRGASIGTGSRGAMRPLLSFLRAQHSPYLPAQAVLVPAGHGKYLLSVQYDAPSPLGFTNGP